MPTVDRLRICSSSHNFISAYVHTDATKQANQKRYCDFTLRNLRIEPAPKAW
jgi:hypothetical protein